MKTTYLAGFILVALGISAMGMVASLFAQNLDGCVEWGIAVILLGVALNATLDKL
jgi:hypothetical protein